MPDHEGEFYMHLTEDQLVDLAAGFVPKVVVAKARTLLDWVDGDRRKAEARQAADEERAQRKRSRTSA